MPTVKAMKSVVPTPEVDRSVKLEPTAVPPVTIGEVMLVVNVGEVPNTTTPLPVSLVIEEARLAEVIEVPRAPPAPEITNLLLVKPEKVMVPEEVMPVAAATAPEEFTWKRSPEPTVNIEAGVVSPIPTLPAPLI